MAEEYGIGIDLGGSHIKFAAVLLEGRVLEEFQGETGDMPAEVVDSFPSGAGTLPPGMDEDTGKQEIKSLPWAESIRQQVERLQARYGPASWVGLAAPGVVAPGSRSIASMPVRMEGLEGLDWTRFLDWPRPIPVMNDAHAALLGEAWRGAAAGLKDVILLTLGTGVGGAILSGGKLLQGHIGRGGHLGHVSLDPQGPPDICGTPGSLEDAIGECTLAQRSGGAFGSTLELVNAYRNGDDTAASIWLKSVYELACAVASFINILDPEAVVIGGGIARAGAALFDPLQQFLDRVEWRPGGHQVRILPATLGEYAGALGAARYAME